MCVAYPGRVVSVSDSYGTVDFSGTEVRVNLRLVPAKVGDFVLVHAGMAIQIVEKDEARDWIALFRDLAAASEEER